MEDLIEEQFINVGEVNLHVITAGDKDGEPVVLLHGFPEYWYGWRNQIPFLAEKGYHVIVPDQRGYNFSDKPVGTKNYTIGKLATDIRNLITALGYEKVNLVGHDWGAAVAWWVATIYPEYLKKLVILNVPYPSVMLDAVKNGNIQQFFRSTYMLFFQLPNVPEWTLSRNNYSALVKGMLKVGIKGSFKQEDFEHYKVAWSQKDALTSMLNWYRALGQRQRSNRGTSSKVLIKPPTLMLWGEKDGALGKELAQPSIEKCLDGELIFFPNASHWIQHDAPDSVNEELHRFLTTKSDTDK